MSALPPLFRFFLAPGGSPTMTDIRRCAYPPCDTLFAPYRADHCYCSPLCARRHGQGITEDRTMPRCEWCDKVIRRSASDRHHRRYHRECWALCRAARYEAAQEAVARARRVEQGATEVIRQAVEVIERVVDGVVFEVTWHGAMVAETGVKGGLLDPSGHEQSPEARALSSHERPSRAWSHRGVRRARPRQRRTA